MEKLKSEKEIIELFGLSPAFLRANRRPGKTVIPFFKTGCHASYQASEVEAALLALRVAVAPPPQPKPPKPPKPRAPLIIRLLLPDEFPLNGRHRPKGVAFTQLWAPAEGKSK
ncbi:MAG: hypothetical protein V4563_05035 [Pseudomonadota bacterium]